MPLGRGLHVPQPRRRLPLLQLRLKHHPKVTPRSPEGSPEGHLGLRLAARLGGRLALGVPDPQVGRVARRPEGPDAVHVALPGRQVQCGVSQPVFRGLNRPRTLPTNVLIY